MWPGRAGDQGREAETQSVTLQTASISLLIQSLNNVCATYICTAYKELKRLTRLGLYLNIVSTSSIKDLAPTSLF